MAKVMICMNCLNGWSDDMYGWSCGVSVEGQGQRAKMCCHLISDSIFWLVYFTATLTGRCNALPKKVPKELYKKKTATDKRQRHFFYTFLYLLGSTTIPWVREFFLNTLKWLNPPVMVSKIRSSFLAYVTNICKKRLTYLVFQASIRVSFLVFQASIRVSFFCKFVKVRLF